MVTKTLFVGNLPFSATEEDIIHHFAAYKSSNARIIMDKGFGFVDVDESLVDDAILEKHDSEMAGRRLTVNLASPKNPNREQDQRRRY